MDIAVVSGTHVGNVDGQLHARPSGPGRLLLALKRGSEVFDVDPGPFLVERRTATPDEEAALDPAAELAVAARRARRHEPDRGHRLNRRKIDVIPEPEWADPPKARIDRCSRRCTARLRRVP